MTSRIVFPLLVVTVVSLVVAPSVYAQRRGRSPRAEENRAPSATTEAPSPESPPARLRKLTADQKADIEKTLEKAAAYFQEGNVQKSAQLIGLASDLDVSLDPPGVMMAKWAALGGNMPMARQLLDTAVIAHPEDPAAFFLLADIARMENRRTEAMLLLARGQELLEKYHANAERKAMIEKSMWSGLAHFAERQNDFSGALTCLAKLETLDPSSAETQLRIGSLYFKRAQGEDEKLALQAFERAFKLDPQQLPPAAYMAQLHLPTGNGSKIASFLEQALRDYPAHVGVLSLAANYHLSKGDFERARQHVDSLARLKPDSAAIHSLQGTLALYRHDLELAEGELRKSMGKSRAEWQVVDLLALVLLEQGGETKIKEGLELAEANIRRAPSQVTAATLAWALYRSGNFESCYRLLDQLLSRESLSSNTAYFAAAILVHRGDRKAAAGLLRAALKSESPFLKRAEAQKLLETLAAETK